ncbi:MAG: UPF0182 family protein [Acidobacteriota bacterium]
MARPDVIDLGDFPRRQTGQGQSGGFGRLGWLLSALILLGSGGTIARWVIDWAWWQEMGQGDTWQQILFYAWMPSVLAGLVALPVLGMLYARGRRGVLTAPKALLALVGSLILGMVLIDDWMVARFLGSFGVVADGWRDPVFGLPIGFYFFQLPFYEMVLRYLQGLLVVGFIVYWVGSRFELLREGFSRMQAEDGVDLRGLNLGDALSGLPVRVAVAIFFLLLAGRAYLSRYDVLRQDHNFMVGADYVDVNIVLPLLWGLVGACVAGAALVMARRVGLAVGLVVLVYLAVGAVPKAVNAISVRPNEISLQKPYIARHIEGTRAAFGLAEQLKERDYDAKMTGKFEPAKYQTLLENVRLWDWQAFHDTISQIQALRTYYVFADTDVDRYRDEKGNLRQVLVSPRELDVQKLPDARSRWINPHFIYTHGYGMVMAEANRITSDGLPHLLMRDAPLVSEANAPKVKRPEIYFGEAVHEPVFVRTAQPEFSYPQGNANVQTRYEGKGGIPISGMGMRLAAALAYADWNVLLTNLLTSESRMLIHRKVAERVGRLAEFVAWDADPYLVVTEQGRQVWMIDGYTVNSMHPYARMANTRFGRLNYIRNSVKATVDAYDGTTVLYAWDEKDTVLQSYRWIFPKLFRPKTEMPADLRSHTRYPESLFRVQSEIYRTYHMQDPEAFYNREDPWDLARTAEGMDGRTEAAQPTYMMALLPGQSEPEFLLLQTFTPRGKQNLIGLMAARCDGERLGEIEVLRLSKQELIYGPMQVAARINQDQTISKDLTLWNQHGSKVIKGQMSVLPMGGQFLYVEPIYIQSSNAPMPELKKVAVGYGNQIGYGNTYAEALSQLGQDEVKLGEPATAPGTSAKLEQPKLGDGRIEKIRERLKQYRLLMGAGKFVEAARELEAIEAEVKP